MQGLVGWCLRINLHYSRGCMMHRSYWQSYFQSNAIRMPAQSSSTSCTRGDECTRPAALYTYCSPSQTDSSCGHTAPLSGIEHASHAASRCRTRGCCSSWRWHLQARLFPWTSDNRSAHYVEELMSIYYLQSPTRSAHLRCPASTSQSCPSANS